MEIVKIGTVAAQNIARSLKLTNVKEIEEAISDEINAMSSHFTLAFADIMTQHEIDLNEIRGSYSFLKANTALVAGVGLLVFVIGAVVGRFV